MRRKGLITALCLLSLFVSSCREEAMPFSDGSSVSFSASSGFSHHTKTEYVGGYVSNDNYERINWLSGDGLTVLSPQAVLYNKTTNPWTAYYTATDPRYCVAHYTVDGTITPDGIYSTAGVAPYEDKGLHWGEGAHLFFGVYPRLSTLPSSVQSYVGIETDATRTKGIIDAYIPKLHVHSSSDGVCVDVERSVFPQGGGGRKAIVLSHGDNVPGCGDGRRQRGSGAYSL